MFEFPEVTAQTFHRFFKSGRNTTALFTCLPYDGDPKEYVVKFHSQLPDGCLREIVASALGRALDVPVAIGVLVHMDPNVGAIDAELAEVLGQSAGPHFGSEFHSGGFQEFTSAYAIPPSLIDDAFDIFAWDMLIANPDRRRGNPNLLVDGHRFVAIDHELALAFSSLLGAPAPELQRLRGTQMADNHVLKLMLKPRVAGHSFDRFISRLEQLPPRAIEQIVDAVPSAWQNVRVTNAIVAHLNTVLASTSTFRRSLLEVFI